MASSSARIRCLSCETLERIASICDSLRETNRVKRVRVERRSRYSILSLLKPDDYLVTCDKAYSNESCWVCPGTRPGVPGTRPDNPLTRSWCVAMDTAQFISVIGVQSTQLQLYNVMRAGEEGVSGWSSCQDSLCVQASSWSLRPSRQCTIGVCLTGELQTAVTADEMRNNHLSVYKQLYSPRPPLWLQKLYVHDWLDIME